MADKENSSITADAFGSTVSDRIHAIAAQLSGVDCTLRMFAQVDDDIGAAPDALELLACSVERMNSELCAIADEISAGQKKGSLA